MASLHLAFGTVPARVTSANTLTFKKHLKTQLFSLSYL